MYRTCEGCKASVHTTIFDSTRFHCRLKYKCETATNGYGIYTHHGKPLEECPKPKTYAELNRLRREKNV